MISAVLLTKEEVVISNVPEILDIKNLMLLLEGMGVEVRRLDKGVYSFKAENVSALTFPASISVSVSGSEYAETLLSVVKTT